VRLPSSLLDVADRLSCSQGAYAENIVSPATHLIPKPAFLPFVDAASIPEVWLTSACRLASRPLALSDACMQRYQALIVLGELKAGRPRPVSGSPRSSSPGSLVRTGLPPPPAIATTDGAQGDRHRDCVEPGQARLPHVRAPEKRDGGRELETQDFDKEVERVTGGHGADVVIDFVSASHWDKNIAALAPDGRMVMRKIIVQVQ
jgi:hypothetical protein